MFTKFGEKYSTTFRFTNFGDYFIALFFTKFGVSYKFSPNLVKIFPLFGKPPEHALFGDISFTKFGEKFVAKKGSPNKGLKFSLNLVKKVSQHLVSPNLVNILSLNFSPNLVIHQNFHKIW